MPILVPGKNNFTQNLCKWVCSNDSTNPEIPHLRVQKLKMCKCVNYASVICVMQGLGVCVFIDHSCVRNIC